MSEVGDSNPLVPTKLLIKNQPFTVGFFMPSLQYVCPALMKYVADGCSINISSSDMWRSTQSAAGDGKAVVTSTIDSG